MNRSAAGLRIQALLTRFAANFIRWADEWIRPRVERSSPSFETLLSRPKRLVRVAANSPAMVERWGSQVLVRFSPLSSFDGVVIRLTGEPGHQLVFSLFENDHFAAI